MPTYSRPGVYFNESTLSTLTSTGVDLTAGTSAVFFGEAERGPTDATLISDWASYKDRFGDLSDSYDLGYAVYHYFANGGRSCFVVRVAAAAAVTSTLAAVPYYPTGSGNPSASLFQVDAIADGVWGDNISVNIEALTDEGGSATNGLIATTDTTYGTFTLVVKYSGVEVERWTAVSIDPDNARYVSAVVNNYSKYITISSVSTTAPDATLEYSIAAYTLGSGSDGTVADSDYQSAVSAVDVLQGPLLLNAVGKTSSAVVTSLVSKAKTRGDSFVIIDPSITDTSLSTTQATATGYSGVADNDYAAVFAPALKMIDPAKTGPGAIRDTYPGGAVAGIFVRTEIQRSISKAAAGLNAEVRGALATVYKLSDSDIGSLYDGTPYINPFRVVPGGGVIVNGARTLEDTASTKFIPVRRTLNHIKYSLGVLTEFAVFEANDSALWARVESTVAGFLGEMYRSGDLKGDNAAQAFYVVCDESNNTSVSIDQGIVNVEVGVALQYPAEFIVVNISQWTGGSNAVESL
jgi:hypothetical protein